MVRMQQVHGNKVVIVSNGDDGKAVPGCDGLITNDPKLELAVRTADCLPILVTDKKGLIHGVIHAGWRGLRKRVIGKTLNLINRKFGIGPSNLRIYIGPHICVFHYEVKGDVAGFFDETVIIDNKKYLDLALVANNQLINLGVLKKNIEINKTCTFESKDHFSYRRDKTNKRNQYLFRLNV